MNEHDKALRDGLPQKRTRIVGADFYFRGQDDGTMFMVDLNLDSQMVDFILDDDGVIHFGITRHGEWKETFAAPRENVAYWRVRESR